MSAPSPATSATSARLPRSEDLRISPEARAHRTRTLKVFAGAYTVLCLLLILVGVAGTTGDPLSSSEGRGYDYIAHGRALAPIDVRRMPRILADPGPNDPLDYDTRPGGPPGNIDAPLATHTPAIDPAEAAADLQRKKEAAELVDQGDKLLQKNRYQPAEDTYLRAVKLEPALKDPIGRKFYVRAKSMEKKRSWSRAKLLYRMALHFDYKNPDYHTALASTSEALGDKKKAAEHRRLAAKFRAER
jgi:tetratricopeptide (TPR) repeat protein